MKGHSVSLTGTGYVTCPRGSGSFAEVEKKTRSSDCSAQTMKKVSEMCHIHFANKQLHDFLVFKRSLNFPGISP